MLDPADDRGTGCRVDDQQTLFARGRGLRAECLDRIVKVRCGLGDPARVCRHAHVRKAEHRSGIEFVAALGMRVTRAAVAHVDPGKDQGLEPHGLGEGECRVGHGRSGRCDVGRLGPADPGVAPVEIDAAPAPLRQQGKGDVVGICEDGTRVEVEELLADVEAEFRRIDGHDYMWCDIRLLQTSANP